MTRPRLPYGKKAPEVSTENTRQGEDRLVSYLFDGSLTLAETSVLLVKLNAKVCKFADYVDKWAVVTSFISPGADKSVKSRYVNVAVYDSIFDTFYNRIDLSAVETYSIIDNAHAAKIFFICESMNIYERDYVTVHKPMMPYRAYTKTGSDIESLLRKAVEVTLDERKHNETETEDIWGSVTHWCSLIDKLAKPVGLNM